MTYGYVPASKAFVKVEGRKYTVVLDGHKIEVSKPDFIEQNQQLSALYTKEKNAERRGEIANRLYELNLPLFTDWDIFNFGFKFRNKGSDDSADYKQTAFLFTVMALEAYDPSKGSFIYWLRFYVKKARDETRGYHANDKYNVSEDDAPEESEEGEQEPVLSLARLKATMSPERWKIIEMKVLHGLKDVEIAAALGVHRQTAKKRIDDSVNALRTGMIMRARQEADPYLNDGSEWLSRKQLAARMGVKISYVYHLTGQKMDPRVAPNKIDPRDITRLGGRIRYKEAKDGGLIYPRIVRRKTRVEMYDA